jgi:hypothetical protein
VPEKKEHSKSRRQKKRALEAGLDKRKRTRKDLDSTSDRSHGRLDVVIKKLDELKWSKGKMATGLPWNQSRAAFVPTCRMALDSTRGGEVRNAESKKAKR